MASLKEESLVCPNLTSAGPLRPSSSVEVFKEMVCSSGPLLEFSGDLLKLPMSCLLP